MKPALKTALTLVAMLALLLGQGVWSVTASPAPTKKMGCCGDACPTHCCVERGSSTPAGPLPVVPVTTSSQQLQEALLPVMLGCFDVVLATSSASDHFPSRFPVSAAVPLYVRTHSFLI